MKWYEEIRKLKTGQGEDYTTECLLDYEYMKNHNKLISADLIRQRELDVDPKAIQKIQFIRKSKNNDGGNANSTEYLFVLEKMKEMRLKSSQGSAT